MVERAACRISAWEERTLAHQADKTKRRILGSESAVNRLCIAAEPRRTAKQIYCPAALCPDSAVIILCSFPE
jgi:hypothetical protein